MTGLLKNMMHDRADRLEAPALDLAEITTAGEPQIPSPPSGCSRRAGGRVRGHHPRRDGPPA